MAPIVFGNKPIPVHIPFHQSPAYERVNFGAFGSGKTYALVDEAHAWCLEQPGIRGLMVRKTAPELRDTLEPIFVERMPPDLWSACTVRRSGGHLESVIYPNGSVVLFRSMDDWNKHRSLNVGFIAYDEMNEIDEESYLGMRSRVRQRDLTAEAIALGYEGQITRRGIWGATNPGGHDWIWEYFVNAPKDGSAYFKSTSLDNPYLPPEYIDDLLTYPEPWVRRYVLCSFDDFGGSVFPEWNWETHMVEPPKMDELPHDALFWMGMDPGTRSPTAGLWVVHDKRSRSLLAVAEYQENYTAAVQHAAKWRSIESALRNPVRWRVADPNVMTRDRGTNMSLHDQYRRLGYNFALGPRQHKDRIPAMGQLIVMGRLKATKATPQFFEQVKRYRWEDLTPAQRAKGAEPREQIHKSNDHLVDCAQYVSSRYVSPAKLTMPEDEELTPMEELSRGAWRAARKQLGRHARAVRAPRRAIV